MRLRRLRRYSAAGAQSAALRLFLGMLLIGLSAAVVVFAGAAPAEERTVGVFVALCDNVHQGIVPVPKAIGDGEDPEHNLYWGTAEGFVGIFGKSVQWKEEEPAATPSGDILRRKSFRHEGGSVLMEAFAYRGSAIQACLQDFEKALSERRYDLVVYIGHNGLMDFPLALPPLPASLEGQPDCIVLCCKSQAYFRARIESLRARPILLTTQLMYPGAFILRDVLGDWVKGGDLKSYRAAAGRSYAANQGISQKAALGVFADLTKG